MVFVCAARAALAGADAPVPPASTPPSAQLAQSVQPGRPAEIASLEAEVVREWNALLLDTHELTDRGPPFRKKIRRLFAASPSFTSLALYASSLNSSDGTPDPSDTESALIQAEFAEMKSALTRDFSKEPAFPPAFQGLALATQEPRGARAPATSVFSRADEVAGWARMNEPLSSPMRSRGALTAQYAIDFDGPSLASLSPVYELAKHLRKNVTVELSNHPIGGLEQATPLFDINTAVLTVELPAYAITQRGLIPGKFTRVGFFGGACSDRQPTAAELTFAEPVEDVVLAVFVTGVNIDIKRARVQVAEQTFPSFGSEVNNGAIRKRVTYTVDLDGDGVPDLHGVSQRDTEPDDDDIYRMRGSLLPNPVLAPIAGWYADDFDYLDANIGGRWLRLSTYHVVTCT